jgi:hypothetical protein
MAHPGGKLSDGDSAQQPRSLTIRDNRLRAEPIAGCVRAIAHRLLERSSRWIGKCLLRRKVNGFTAVFAQPATARPSRSDADVTSSHSDHARAFPWRTEVPAVLGIDAAWNDRHASGVALVVKRHGQWQLASRAGRTVRALGATAVQGREDQYLLEGLVESRETNAAAERVARDRHVARGRDTRCRCCAPADR